jgi:hypothetical protein
MRINIEVDFEEIEFEAEGRMCLAHGIAKY